MSGIRSSSKPGVRDTSVPPPALPEVEYHVLQKPLIEMAKDAMDPKRPSLCAFCARMKRGMLYTCMRENGYTTLALGQHLDDVGPSPATS